ncbi:MAG: hypothetical protein ACPLXC_02835 [Candidatus Pacearchaeota archaeon]
MKIKNFSKFFEEVFLGKKPLLLLDTSAIIEFEKKQKAFLESILKKEGIVFVSEGVMEEVEAHRNIMINSHKRELSEKTYELVKSAYEKSPKILEKILPFVAIPYEEISEKVCTIIQELPKKRTEDEMSIIDANFIVNVLIFYSAIHQAKERLPTSLVALTGDEKHIIRPLVKLRDDYFPNKNNLYIIRSREDKHGHYIRY